MSNPCWVLLHCFLCVLFIYMHFNPSQADLNCSVSLAVLWSGATQLLANVHNKLATAVELQPLSVILERPHQNCCLVWSSQRVRLDRDRKTPSFILYKNSSWKDELGTPGITPVSTCLKSTARSCWADCSVDNCLCLLQTVQIIAMLLLRKQFWKVRFQSWISLVIISTRRYDEYKAKSPLPLHPLKNSTKAMQRFLCVVITVKSNPVPCNLLQGKIEPQVFQNNYLKY